MPTGVMSTTGIAGLTLSGGHGYLSRKYGLTIDNLIEADVVLADGSFLTTSIKNEPDLFWALRGGGGNFGIVTSFLFKLHPVSMVFAGPIAWDQAHGRLIMQRYREFLPTAPEELEPQGSRSISSLAAAMIASPRPRSAHCRNPRWCSRWIVRSEKHAANSALITAPELPRALCCNSPRLTAELTLSSYTVIVRRRRSRRTPLTTRSTRTLGGGLSRGASLALVFSISRLARCTAPSGMPVWAEIERMVIPAASSGAILACLRPAFRQAEHRSYQQYHDATIIGSMRSVDLSKTKVSGGLPAEPLTEARRKAAARLRSIEAQVEKRYGDVGVGLVRAVLADRRPVEAAARSAGAVSEREFRSWGWLFRKCLDVIAVATG